MSPANVSSKLLTSDQKSDQPNSEYGLHTLVARDPLADGVTDIVAVHGLNGHYEKTWTEEVSQYNWLRDSFTGASETITARVMSFAYNAKVQSSKSTADIFDFAAQLLECLLSQRETVIEQRRPIVFICHSLGGIVFKQAFNAACSQSRYENLAKKTIGAMFFSTPHRGSSMASFAAVLGKVMKAAAFGANTNTTLLKDLQQHSPKLEQVSNIFLQEAGRLRIITFYELNKMDFMNSVVVDKDSAIMHMRAETAVPLDCDHRNICKFASRSSLNLGIVLTNLAGLIRQATSSKLQREEVLLRQSLATSNPDHHKSRNPKPVSGTCDWILKHPTFVDWLDSSSLSLLWLSADPGCGKSVLASFLVDHLRRENLPGRRRWNICYFFFKSDNDEQRDAVHGLQSILHQLFQSQSDLLGKAVEGLSSKNIRSVQALWHGLTEAMNHPKARDTICILDGLDECEPESRKILTKSLSMYFSVTEDPAVMRNNGEGASLKCFISSRPHNSLKMAFDRPRTSSAPYVSCSMIRLRGEDETDAVSHDIGLVIDAEISEFVNHGFPEDLLEDVRHELVARADRTFLWVTLILELLKEKVEAGASRRELNKILRSRGVDVIYANMLSTRPDAPKARKLLSIVLAATRPLSVEELSIALAVRPEASTFDTQNLPRRPGEYSMLDIEDDLVYPFENHLKALCGNFIRIIRNSIYLVHETARDFLIELEGDTRMECRERLLVGRRNTETEGDNEDNSSPATINSSFAWRHSFKLLECRATLLEVCVTYIYCMGKTSSGFKTGEPSRRLSPFLDYAAVAWTSHLRAVRDRLSPSELPYYQNLCHPQFPGFEAWIRIYEASNTKGRSLPVGSDDEVQDYYVNLFEMELDAPSRRLVIDSVALQNMTAYSSNPAAANNHHFPVTANANGWVSLNMEQARLMFKNAFLNPWSR
ncbi:hypothetical protein QQS21_006038 [Conoideocrella luteorostrata]|uniref:NACHT domain-containing protein n=1 Tax=Conoideocrella luteorostrata TaxID=1105319 RepID=A0AAJ0FT97_9HYPO|nr:hypothetical protein QQS21_006038 [Conoideocrella luteorostrata]